MGKYRVSIMLLGLAGVLATIASMVGGYVNEQNILVEPAFFCIPLAMLSLSMALITAIFISIKTRVAK